jgi:L-amino acid N-acyltransferase YncA
MTAATSPAPVVREADPSDLPAILAIYNEVIATSDAIFADDPVTLDSRRAWLASKRERGHPALVAELVTGEVAGFATYGPFRAWPGYRDTVEHSIHVGSPHRRRGVGHALLTALIERARLDGVHVMVAGIDGGNASSIEFHAAHGFVHAGLLKEVGRKGERRLDLVFMQLTL